MTRVGERIAALPSRLRRLRRRSWLLAGVGVTLLTAAACNSTNTYPIDFFSEMHYQAAWHAQEPPRLDSPESAIAHGELAYADIAPFIPFEQANRIDNPLDASQENRDRGAALFEINCDQCHGTDGQGDGFMSNYAQAYQEQGANPPADLTSDAIQQLSDGQIYWIITHGINRMPSFGNLLTPEERWELVLHIRDLGGE